MKVRLITIVIPCFNEEFNIEEFYRRITALKIAMQPNQFEFIFVNDCSSDATGSILNNLADQNPEVRVLHLAQNMGHQIALTAGLDSTMLSKRISHRSGCENRIFSKPRRRHPVRTFSLGTNLRCKAKTKGDHR